MQQLQIENSQESWVSSIKDQAIYHVSLAYNLANHDCQSQPWWTDLSEKHIVLGALPFHDRKHVERLKKLGMSISNH